MLRFAFKDVCLWLVIENGSHGENPPIHEGKVYIFNFIMNKEIERRDVNGCDKFAIARWHVWMPSMNSGKTSY